MDTKALRQKILDLAIQGKLVPQDSNDESAAVLVERIGVERERLVKDGKIKKTGKNNTVVNERNKPFDIPESWKWVELQDFTYNLLYGTSEKSSLKGKVAVLRMGNINQTGEIDWTNLVYTSNNNDILKYSLENNDLLFNRTNSSEWVGKTAIYKGTRSAIYAGYLIRVRTFVVCPDYINIVLNSSFHRDWCNEVKSDAVNQSNINAQKLASHLIPIPPLAEQHRIVSKVKQLFSVIDSIEQSQSELSETISQAKAKILDLAVSGKLIKKKTEWRQCKLGDALKYEQPQKYIVRSTKYSDAYDTPVLTAGKSFILGYTDEQDNVFDNLPCIIFDDFTTDSKYVDFRFKVKSSAMKILHPQKGTNARFLSFVVKANRLKDITHKRYWISVLSQKEIDLPSLSEQHDIVAKVDKLFAVLDRIKGNIE